MANMRQARKAYRIYKRQGGRNSLRAWARLAHEMRDLVVPPWGNGTVVGKLARITAKAS